MLHLSFEASNISEVDAFLATHRVQELVSKSKSVLVQVFASELEGAFVEQLNASITKAVPHAVIIGTTTSGEIIKGKSVKNSTVLSFSFFEEAEVKAIVMDCPKGHEQETGEILAKKVMKSSRKIKGVLLLATTQTVNGGELLDGIRSAIGNFPLFGAGAGCYDYNNKSFIFYGDKVYKEGVIAVVFSGETLNIKVYTYLGWQALSKEMTVTEVYNHLLVKKIDDAPAALLYEKYLKIDKNDNFFHKVIEFPLMVMRDGCELARIPAACLKDGSMCFGADIRNGEKVRLAYGNPERIIMDSYVTQRLMEEFRPQGIFLYSCVCRQIFLQESIQLETLPFQDIANTSGFYTYGEFYGSGKSINMLNCTMVAVGFREGDNEKKKVNKIARVKPVVDKGSLNISLSTRLAYFAEAVVAELEDANRKLQELSNTDILTQLYNRGKIDSV